MKRHESAVIRLLADEVLYLDERRWDDWLALYTDDCLFWAPTWLTEDQLATDPESQLSFIYLNGKAALKERVWRIKSGLSRASNIRHRTVHVLGSWIVVDECDQDEVRVLSAGSVHVFNPENSSQACFFGRYEHTLRLEGGSWRVARKHIKLMNDHIPTMLDFNFI